MGDLRTTTGQKPPETAVERRGRLRRILRTAGGVVAVIFLLGYFVRPPKYAHASGYATTPGYAEVRAAVEGRVKTIVRSSGDAVEAGDPLLQLEDRAERTAYEEALARVAEAEADLVYREGEAADIQIRHRNALAAAELEAEHARRNLELTRQLFDKSLASGRQLANDEYAVTRAEEALRALREIDATVPMRHHEVLRQRVQSLREAAERARVALEQRVITAPIAGRVMRYTFYPGEVIRPDMVLYEIFDGPVCTMKVRVPERYASRVRKGQEAQARLGTHRTLIPRRFPGRVAFLRPVVEGDGLANYRVVYCDLDLTGLEIPPGTSVDVRIRIGRASVWGHLLEP